MDRCQANTVTAQKVPAGAIVSARLLPRDNIRFYGGAWTEVPYLPKDHEGSKEEFEDLVMAYIGSTMEVLLAVVIDGVAYDYRFSFEIIDAGVRSVVPARRHESGVR